MSLEGGNWVWSASLRYVDTALLLGGWLLWRRGPDYLATVLADPIACVFLLTLGALPMFGALVLMTLPAPPSVAQIVTTAVIALFAGCLATTLFIYARNLSSDPCRIAAVEATQAGEVGFSFLGEMLVLGAPYPNHLSLLGLGAVMGGLLGFTLWGRVSWIRRGWMRPVV